MVIPIVFGKKSKIVDTGEVGDFVQSKNRIPFHGGVYAMEEGIAQRFGTYFHLDPSVFRFFF